MNIELNEVTAKSLYDVWASFFEGEPSFGDLDKEEKEAWEAVAVAAVR